MKAMSEEKEVLIGEIKEAIEELKKVRKGISEAKPARDLLDELNEDESELLKTGFDEATFD